MLPGRPGCSKSHEVWTFTELQSALYSCCAPQVSSQHQCTLRLCTKGNQVCCCGEHLLLSAWSLMCRLAAVLHMKQLEGVAAMSILRADNASAGRLRTLRQQRRGSLR